jgi:hypothetical protein
MDRNGRPRICKVNARDVGVGYARSDGIFQASDLQSGEGLGARYLALGGCLVVGSPGAGQGLAGLGPGGDAWLS